MVEKKKVRIGLGAFDLIKGIAIIAVILHHTRSGQSGVDSSFLVNLLKSFSCGLMPMFFIVSGYQFNRKSPIKMLKKSFSELIIPYLIMIPIAPILHYLFCWLIYPNREHCINTMRNMLTDWLSGVLYIGALWFFLALFFANNLLNLILKYKKTLIQVVLVCLCVFLGFVFAYYDFKCYCSAVGMTAVGYCYIGYILKEKKILGKLMYSIWSYIVLVPFYVLQSWIFINGGNGLDMWSGDYSFASYFLGGSIGLLILFVGIMLNDLKWKWLDLLRKCGMYSYWILIIHAIDRYFIPADTIRAHIHVSQLSFVIILGLRVWAIVIGCSIIKKISQIRYRQRLERKGKEYSV